VDRRPKKLNPVSPLDVNAMVVNQMEWEENLNVNLPREVGSLGFNPKGLLYG